MNNEISRIDFGIFSSDEIRKMSVCEINKSKMIGKNSIYDERMGIGGINDTSDFCQKCALSCNGKHDIKENEICKKCAKNCVGHYNAQCVTCLRTQKECTGHFGHIELNVNLIHPLYYNMVLSFLRCFCIDCYSLLIMEDHILLNNINQYKHEKKFEKILKLISKIDICCKCFNPQPSYTLSTDNNTISMIYKQSKNNQNVSIVLTNLDIKKIFDNISSKDIEILGFNPDRIHPKNLIMGALPVIPPNARPFVMADGNICDDDLTIQYIEIIKSVNHLKDDNISEIKRQKFLQSLKFRIQTLFNNSKKKAKHTTNGRPIKSIKDRLTGKEGHLRLNLLGKRCEFTARTVIGPDPTLKMGEIAIPSEIASNLTYPERVTSFNIDRLRKIIESGKANFVVSKQNDKEITFNLNYATFRRGTKLLYGDVILRGNKEIIINNGREILKKGDLVRRNGVILDECLKMGDIIIRNENTKILVKNPNNHNIKRSDKVIRDGNEITLLIYPSKKKFNIKVGDIVKRHLHDGDIVLLNRQPTLHSGSMLAKKIIVREGKTIRMNLACTKSFNADFDGDEMNLHIPQSEETRAELEILSSTKNYMISPQGSKPNIVIVQDSLLGAYMMTKNPKKIKKGYFFDITMKCFDSENNYWDPNYILNKLKHIRKILKIKNKKKVAFNGKGLFSLLLPNDLNYEKKNNGSDEEPIVKIYRGVLYEGIINKNIIGSSNNSLLQILYKEYGSEIASNFIDNVQFITNAYLELKGFSIGIKDCIATKDDEIENTVLKCFLEAKGVEQTTKNPRIKEMRISASLGKARDSGLKIAKEALASSNNFISTVTSGSKGDFFNVAQITGLLGQQDILGGRIQPVLNNGKRTLPHYPFNSTNTNLNFESRGFVKHSFIRGLDPTEFYFHAMSGREKITDTAMGTSKSGYMQRRIVKCLEDLQIQHDGTIRNHNKTIYQLSYGDDSMNATETIKVNGENQICNVTRLVDKLNMNIQNKL